MNPGIFVSFCLSISLGVTYFYVEVKDHFADPGPYLKQIDHLEDEVEKEKFRHLLTAYEFEDFRQYTATLLPAAIQEKGPGEKSYPLRTLASVVQDPDRDKWGTINAKALFDKGKRAFRDRQYDIAIGSFEEVLQKHSYSAHVLESLFLKLESHYQLRHYSQASRTLELMVELFPSHELTGYSMLRVGKIYEFQNRHDDAIRLYETVLKVFPDRSLASSARESLRSVEL